jgi:hypothetical protein
MFLILFCSREISRISYYHPSMSVSKTLSRRIFRCKSTPSREWNHINWSYVHYNIYLNQFRKCWDLHNHEIIEREVINCCEDKITFLRRRDTSKNLVILSFQWKRILPSTWFNQCALLMRKKRNDLECICCFYRRPRTYRRRRKTKNNQLLSFFLPSFKCD